VCNFFRLIIPQKKDKRESIKQHSMSKYINMDNKKTEGAINV